MRKKAKSLFYIAFVLILCFLFYFQLKKNKQETKQIAELANIKGRYYPVKVIQISPKTYSSTYTATGFLESQIDLNLIAETQGRIIRIYKRKGDYVNEGDLIAKVDDELLKVQLEATRASYEQLKKDVERYTKLEKENAVTNQQLEEIRLNYITTKAKYISAKKQLENTNIKAPVSGYIENDFIEIGQLVGGSSPICNIIDPDNLKLNLEISEDDYKSIELGQKVRISSSIYPDKNFIGRISYLGKKAGFGNSFNTEIELEKSANNLLKAGMFVSAKINIKSDSEKFFVPREAIKGSLKEALLFLVKNDKAVLTKVITGKVVDDQVQIIEGLNAGDTVITEGTYNIYDQASIRILNF